MQAKFSFFLALLLAGCGDNSVNISTITPRTRPAVPASAPPPVVAPDPAMFRMSETVNGLVMRVENIRSSEDLISDTNLILLRLENQGSKSLNVPAGALDRNTAPFTLQARLKGVWVDVPWNSYKRGAADLSERQGYPDRILTLASGQSAVIYLEGRIVSALTTADLVRVELHMADNSNWQGTLCTPERAIHISDAQRIAQAGQLDFPSFFPALNRLDDNGNGSGNESEYWLLYFGNKPLLEQLVLYKPDPVRANMEKRMAEAPDVPHRLIPALQAALRGSKLARDYIDQCRQSTSYDTLNCVFDALVLAAFDESRPAWVTQLMAEEILNSRTIVKPDTHRVLSISQMVEERQLFSLRLGQLHCLAAVPSLIKKMQMGAVGRDAVTALGEIGDPQAIPALLKVLQDSSSFKWRHAAGMALAKLHAAAALPIFMAQPEAFAEELEILGDPGAAAALKTKSSLNARLAVITLSDPDPTMAYIRIMEDLSLDQYDRRKALSRLGDHPDPRAIPALIRAIKTDPSGAVVNNAITILGDCYRYPEAVTGLLECLDVDFNRSADWKRAYKPEMFREHIAQVLRAMTGQSLGADRAQWEVWWNAVGRKL